MLFLFHLMQLGASPPRAPSPLPEHTCTSKAVAAAAALQQHSSSSTAAAEQQQQQQEHPAVANSVTVPTSS